MPILAITSSQAVALIRTLIAARRRGVLAMVLLALAALLVSAPASASTLPVATLVIKPHAASSAERHVSALTLRVPHVRANARRLGAPGARSAASTTGRAAPLTARGRHHGALQGAGDFSAGVSSALTFGLSDKLIGATGLGRYGSKCSTAHAVGRGAGFALGLVGASIASLGKAAVVEGAEAAEAASSASQFARLRASLAAEEIKGAPAVGSALKSDAFHRAASFMVDEAAASGQVFTIAGRTGAQNLTQVVGELNGVSGRFEWIVNAQGSLTHQMFVPGGAINGIPIIP